MRKVAVVATNQMAVIVSQYAVVHVSMANVLHHTYALVTKDIIECPPMSVSHCVKEDVRMVTALPLIPAPATVVIRNTSTNVPPSAHTTALMLYVQVLILAPA